MLTELLSALLLLLGECLAQNEPVAYTPLGKVKGYWMTSRSGRRFQAYSGIPYAMPPIGLLRFQNPQPALPWAGARDALEDGPYCIQYNVYQVDPEAEGVVGVEDCLYLSINTHNTSGKSAVLVHFHGGGFLFGDGPSIFKPNYFMDEDVVVVNVNFRVGIMGFLSFEDEVMPGNQGLKDQVISLKWIQQNIKYFGGDKKKVTIIGESTGSMSVYHHIVSPLSLGLFQQAIAESGSSYNLRALNPPNYSRELALKLTELTGCKKNKRQSTAQLVTCLQSLNATFIVSQLINYRIFQVDPEMLFGPTMEYGPGAFLTCPRSKWVHARVPVLMGTTSAEGLNRARFFVKFDTDWEEFSKNFDTLGPISLTYFKTAPDPQSVTKSIRAHYFPKFNIIDNGWSNVVQTYTDEWYAVGIFEGADKQSNVTDVYFYYFDYLGEFTLSGLNRSLDIGASHVDETIYLWYRTQYSPLAGEDLILSKKMVKLWTNFAKYGTPTPEGSEFDWVTWDKSDQRYLNISNSGFSMGKKLGIISEDDGSFNVIEDSGSDTSLSELSFLKYCCFNSFSRFEFENETNLSDGTILSLATAFSRLHMIQECPFGSSVGPEQVDPVSLSQASNVSEETAVDMFGSEIIVWSENNSFGACPAKVNFDFLENSENVSKSSLTGRLDVSISESLLKGVDNLILNETCGTGSKVIVDETTQKNIVDGFEIAIKSSNMENNSGDYEIRNEIRKKKTQTVNYVNANENVRKEIKTVGFIRADESNKNESKTIVSCEIMNKSRTKKKKVAEVDILNNSSTKVSKVTGYEMTNESRENNKKTLDSEVMDEMMKKSNVIDCGIVKEISNKSSNSIVDNEILNESCTNKKKTVYFDIMNRSVTSEMKTVDSNIENEIINKGWGAIGYKMMDETKRHESIYKARYKACIKKPVVVCPGVCKDGKVTRWGCKGTEISIKEKIALGVSCHNEMTERSMVAVRRSARLQRSLQAGEPRKWGRLLSLKAWPTSPRMFRKKGPRKQGRVVANLKRFAGAKRSLLETALQQAIGSRSAVEKRLLDLASVLVNSRLITNLLEFYIFLMTYTPFEFQKKVLPLKGFLNCTRPITQSTISESPLNVLPPVVQRF